MSITPFETLAVAPKSQEASIYKTNQLQKENNQQTQIAGLLHQTSEQKMNRTEKSVGKDGMQFQYDAKQKGNNEYASKEQKEKKEREKAEKDAEDRKRMLGCTFDITV